MGRGGRGAWRTPPGAGRAVQSRPACLLSLPRSLHPLHLFLSDSLPFFHSCSVAFPPPYPAHTPPPRDSLGRETLSGGSGGGITWKKALPGERKLKIGERPLGDRAEPAVTKQNPWELHAPPSHPASGAEVRLTLGKKEREWGWGGVKLQAMPSSPHPSLRRAGLEVDRFLVAEVARSAHRGPSSWGRGATPKGSPPGPPARPGPGSRRPPAHPGSGSGSLERVGTWS